MAMSVLDIILSAITVCVGSYYLYQNRENRSYLRIAVLLIVGSVALDALYSMWTLSMYSSYGYRSATILFTKAAIGALCSVLSFAPNRCELPAVHHLADTDIRKCVAVQKKPQTSYASQQLSRVG